MCVLGVRDPYKDALTQIAHVVKPWPLEEVNTELDSNEKSNFALRPPVQVRACMCVSACLCVRVHGRLRPPVYFRPQELARQAATHFSDNMYQLLTGLANETITCPHIAAIKSSFHETYCCDLLYAAIVVLRQSLCVKTLVPLCVLAGPRFIGGSVVGT